MVSPRLNRAANICRIIVGLTFVFSGFVKAVDPWGTALKVNEYLSIYGIEQLQPLSMIFSIWLCGAELMMGLMLTFKVRTRLISIFALVSMTFFTVLTFLSATWIPVEDCGCFGDALKLTPWETFLKNLIILPMVVVVWYRHRKQRILDFRRWEIVATITFCTIAMGVGTYCYFNLPLIDFLPYDEGSNIYAMIAVQHDTGSEEMSEEEYVLIYRNRQTGEVREFSIDDKEWQDESRWEWVETRVDNEAPAVQTLVSEFTITDPEGDVTRDLLTRSGYVYMICVTELDDVNEKCAERLRRVVDHAIETEGLVVCLTPQPLREVTHHSFAESDPVRCYNIDATVMKTMLRAKNGLVVLKDGVIEKKYNCRNIDF
ncbi:MAG: DoxX family protein [Alistipes sp.]|jgi:triosephosphate isomerase|nr:DoxX family protein [Alistipes sp.]MBQ5830774.1 DoxX family protein [Alistipes sp.]MBR0332715.1 DoxX family protein [Alistipes sp.]